jgi:hypothetical protein
VGTVHKGHHRSRHLGVGPRMVEDMQSVVEGEVCLMRRWWPGSAALLSQLSKEPIGARSKPTWPGNLMHQYGCRIEHSLYVVVPERGMDYKLRLKLTQPPKKRLQSCQQSLVTAAPCI